MATVTDFGSNDPFGSGYGAGGNIFNADDPFGIGSFGDPFSTDTGYDPIDGEPGSGGSNRFLDFLGKLFGGNDKVGQSLFNMFLGALTANEQRKSGNRSAAFTQQALERARALADPKRVEEITRQLTPLFKEAIAAGTGPQLQQAISANVARRGLTGTGIGLAAQNAASTIPGIESFRAALDQAGKSQTQQVNTELGIGSIGVPRSVGTLESLLLGAALGKRGGMFNNDPTQQQPASQSGASGNLFTNLTPQVQR